MEKPSIDDLILKGIVEVSAVGENGELLYNFTDDVYDLLPELLEEQVESIQEDILYFAENGFLDMIEYEDGETKVRLTRKAFNQQEIAQLPPDKQKALSNLKKFFER